MHRFSKSFIADLQLEEQREAAKSEDTSKEQSVLSNLYLDCRIPEGRAQHLEDFVADRRSRKNRETITNCLAAYNRDHIQTEPKDRGFADRNNVSNRLETLATGDTTLKVHRKASFARIVNLANESFLKRRIVAGAKYLVNVEGKDPADFRDLFGDVSSPDLDACYTFLCSAASLPMVEARDRLAPLFRAWAGYASGMKRYPSKYPPFEPFWAASWSVANERGFLGKTSCAATWCESFAVPHAPLTLPVTAKSVPPLWGLFKYQLPSAISLYRPTSLEAGRFPYHFPTHCAVSCPICAKNGSGTHTAISGHPMNCSESLSPPRLVREWVHSEIALTGDQLMSLRTPSRPWDDSLLTARRQRHLRLLKQEYSDFPEGLNATTFIT